MNCPNCQTEIEPGYEICWKCQYSFANRKVIKSEDTIETLNHSYASIKCLRCSVTMIYAGQRKFHEGFHFGTVGILIEFLSEKDTYDLFLCPRCGKVEFFVPVPAGFEDQLTRS